MVDFARPAKTSAPAPDLQRIVLTGFMGSGKSTVGCKLAERLGWPFLDLDREVELQDGRSVPEIFAESGEAAFRSLETAVLDRCLGQEALVLALGGGVPESEECRSLLDRSRGTAVVYLAAPLHILIARCEAQAVLPDAVARPLFAGSENVLLHRYTRRQPHYEAVATHRVDTAEQAPGDTVEAILRLLSGTHPHDPPEASPERET